MDDFCDNYIMPCVKANAVYENKYLLGTSMARPAIAKRLVEIARKEGASAICHGATGKGNDQIRFELGHQGPGPGYQNHRSLAYDRCMDHAVPRG
ncbi:MAG: argininosuccinate synthase domain-containing protein [Enterocloster clostridioformis]